MRKVFCENSSKKGCTDKKGSELAAVILSAVLVMALTACGGESTGPGYTVGGMSGSTASERGVNNEGVDGANVAGGSTNAGTNISTTIGEITVESKVEDEMVYVADTLDVATTDIMNFYSMKVNGDALCYGSQHTVVSLPLSGESMQMDVMKWEEQTGEWNLKQLAFDNTGNVYSVVTITARPNSKSFICKFDSEGQLVYSYALSEDLEAAGVSSWSSTWDIEADEDGNAYLKGTDFVWLFDAEGKFTGELKLGSSPSYDVTSLGRDENGRVYVIYNATGSVNDSYIGEIDFSSKSTVNVNKGAAMKGLSAGLDGSLLTFDKGALYYYDKAACTMTPALKWLECNIDANYLQYAEKAADGRIVAVTINSGSGGEVYLIERMTKTEAESRGLLSDKITITMAIWGTGNKQELQAAIAQFNKENERYNVVTEDYIVGVADGEAAVNRLTNEIMAGKGPDLIDEDFGVLADLAKKGGIENLYDYLEKSEKLSKEDFFENVLEEYTVDGVLTAIPYDLMIGTLVGSSDVVGEEMGWTLDEMLTTAEKYPDVQFIGRQGVLTKRSIIMDILKFYGGTFLDWEAGTCNFATEEFKKILKFAEDYPDNYTAPAENAPSIYTKLETGETILAEVSIWRIRELQAYNEALKEKLVCIGYPTPEGVGCTVQTMSSYGISSQSQHKEGAWEFLEFFLQYSDFSNATSVSGFPSNKRTLEELIKRDMAYSNSSVMHASDGWKYQYHPTTQEEADQIYALIDSMNFSSVNLKVINIICEEADSYFSGQKPIDVVVEIIQNRVQNYMDENR